MSQPERLEHAIARDDPGLDGLVVLIVGDVQAWTAEGRRLPESSELTFAEFDEVSATLLREVRPDIVLSSVITAKFDAFDLAAVLCDAGFAGRYRALSPRLPNPDLVRREVRSICPALDFDLLLIDQATSLRPN